MYIVVDSKIFSYRGFKKLVTIPESLGGYSVTSIWVEGSCTHDYAIAEGLDFRVYVESFLISVK